MTYLKKKEKKKQFARNVKVQQIKGFFCLF